jgi:2-haloacid dehalogenase
MREIVTFDAYATLVDFELGPTTLKVLAERLDLDNLEVDEFLDDFRVMRFQAVLEACRPYHEVLRSSLRMAMRLHGLEYRTSDGDALVEAVPTFGPFPEVAAALRALKSKYEIAIISNSDDNLIARNVENIGVEFDYVITAQQAGAYKPDRQAFEHVRRAARPVGTAEAARLPTVADAHAQLGKSGREHSSGLRTVSLRS